MKVYVAGSSDQLERVKDAMAALRERGHTVTHDWVREIEAVGSANPPDAAQEDRAQWACQDLVGVQEADVLWLLMPSEGGWGAAVEFGYAIRMGEQTDTRIIISGAHNRSIFSVFAHECYDRDDQALEEFADLSPCGCEFGVVYP